VVDLVGDEPQSEPPAGGGERGELLAAHHRATLGAGYLVVGGRFLCFSCGFCIGC
jgi:hypothetical protein